MPRDLTALAPQWRERFERLVERKTREAIAAALPPYVTERGEVPDGTLAVGNEWSARLFDGPFYVSGPRTPDRPACSLVFVQSADGNTGARDPSTLGGGNTDKHLVYEGLSRVAADAVLAGVETVRGGQSILSVWHPQLVAVRAALGLPRHPTQIVATTRGLDLANMLMFNVPEVPAIVLTIPTAAASMQDALRARPWITTLLMPGPGDLNQAFERLRSNGVARVSCIGGRTLAGGLLDARLVDEVYLTTAPRPGGEPDTPLYRGVWRGRVILRKHGTGPESGVVFEHVLPPAPPED